ncbi:Para-hydroxybenzoate--polyprenyltransferase, mitochondrial [Termitomyces sp. J132]|nr:Para-hydroxybenzoate--polyprenyltransferase, mitochondrial [Termitomyces sp. J132]
MRLPLDLASSHVRPYLELIRLEKPTGTVLMFWPLSCGLTIAAFATSLPLQVYGSHLIERFISAFLLRSSTCTVNDIFDREIDAGVENTKNNGHPGWIVWCSLMVDYLLSIGFFQYVRS